MVAAAAVATPPPAVAAMPAPMGVMAWPGGKSLATLVDEEALAFPDAFFDRFIARVGPFAARLT